MDTDEIQKKIAAETQAAIAAKLNPISEELRKLKESVFTSLGMLEQKVKVTLESEVQSAVAKHLAPIIAAAEAAAAASAAAASAAAAAPHPPAIPSGQPLYDALLSIDRSHSQVEILTNLLTSVNTLAPRVLLTVLKGETLVGWSGKGLPLSETDVRRLSIPLKGNTSLKHSVDTAEFFWGDAASHPDNPQVFQMIGEAHPKEILVTPLVLKGKVMAILYCDDGGKEGALSKVDNIKILSWATSNTLDALAFRAKVTRPLPPAAVPAAPAPAAQQPEPQPRREPAAPVVTARDPRSGTNPEIMRAVLEPPAPAVHPAEVFSPEEKKRHDDAKRLARVLVADLILYHRTDVDIGKRNKDLYQRLREDIDRSRQTYLERVGPEMAAKTNYLFEEMVKTLADGHPEALAGF
ncbi:MAG: hypothetical protein HYX75_01440 [Acidobacteria bacterium]|nr:hypothetical protein [Acidobacteriota bacterium]